MCCSSLKSILAASGINLENPEADQNDDLTEMSAETPPISDEQS